MEKQRNNEYDVFISYARKDYVDVNKNVIPDNAITKLTNAFDKSDISYWIDEKGIYSGDRFAKMIANSIKNSKVFLFISSENSNASEWTIGEIAVAREYKKKIIPFRIDDSAYNENVIVYLAPIDYASYMENPEKSIKKVVDSVNEYKEFLKKEKEEEERIAAIEQAKQQEQKKLEWENKQKEIHRKELERLAAISEEKKKKEEELNAVYNQLHDLDAEATERKEKKIQLENEIKTIDNKLSFIDKQREQLDARRKYLEKQISVYNHGGSVAKNDPMEEERPAEPIETGTGEHVQESPKKISISKRWYIVAIVFAAATLLCLKYCGTRSDQTILDGDTICVDIDRIDVDTNTIEPISNESEILELVPVENDIVYGIETVGRIKNWNDLHFLIDGEPNKLHKVSFAFIKVMEGISDSRYVQESKKNREDALKAGIRVALYHSLNIIENETYATGKAQAQAYYKYVKQLTNNELPPVLVVPPFELGQETCTIQRCNEWIDEIKSLYNVKPIVYIVSGNYKSDFRGRLHDCTIWMERNSIVSPTFIKMPSKKVKYYNGTQPYEEEYHNWRLSSFSGSYSEFLRFK